MAGPGLPPDRAGAETGTARDTTISMMVRKQKLAGPAVRRARGAGARPRQYIICGASRAGKSTLARRLQERFKVSWILGDAIVCSMEDVFPDLGISQLGDLQEIGNRFANYIKFMLSHYDYAGCGYVLDTTHLYPRHIVDMREKIGNVPVVFLGYTQADPGEKLRQIRSFDPVDWWTSKLSDTELKQLIDGQISKSIELKEGCLEMGIPYVDVSHHFAASMDRAEAILNKR